MINIFHTLIKQQCLICLEEILQLYCRLHFINFYVTFVKVGSSIPLCRLLIPVASHEQLPRTFILDIYKPLRHAIKVVSDTYGYHTSTSSCDNIHFTAPNASVMWCLLGSCNVEGWDKEFETSHFIKIWVDSLIITQ